MLHGRLLLPSGGGFKDMGVHAFLVQLRDEQHRPLPGVRLGDIGPKLGFQSIDNGWAAFEHVRVPRSALLGGIASVGRDGAYSRVRGGDKRM